MRIRIIYTGVDETLLHQMEFYGLDYLNFLKLLIISCNQKMYSINLIESWLKHHDSFYYHDDLIQVMRQIAQVVSFTVKPWSLGKTMLSCELENISD